MHDVEKPNFQSSISNVINNRHDLRNYLFVTGDIGKSIRENLKLVVTDGKHNDVIIVHALDPKDKHILVNPNPLKITFKGIKKFDAQNPIIGKVLTQRESSKLSDKKIKERLGQLKDREIEAWLSNLRRNNNFNNNYNNNNNNCGGRPTGNLPGPQPPLPSPGAPDEPFDPFAVATAPLPSPPGVNPSAPSYLHEIPPPPDSNTLFTERITIADTNPNLRGTSTHRPVIVAITGVSKEEPSAPELPLEHQIRVSPTLRRTFPEVSDQKNEN